MNGGFASRVSRRCRALAAVATAASLSGCEPGVLDPAGPVASGDKLIMLDSLAIMLAIVIPTIVATLGFAWWFRAGNAKAKHLPDWEYSGRLELLVWSVPALVVIFLGGLAWVGSHELDPPKPIAGPAPLRVEVVSLDWKWLFIYPDQGVASVNRLVVPVGQPVAFHLTSASVMNSFFVPRLGSQIYTMAGMETVLNLKADHPGAYRGLSAQYSGKGFPGMAFTLDAVPQRQFTGWIVGSKGRGAPLDGPAYLALLKESENVAPYTFRAVAPGMFAAIIRHSAVASAPPATDGRGR